MRGVQANIYQRSLFRGLRVLSYIRDDYMRGIKDFIIH